MDKNSVTRVVVHTHTHTHTHVTFYGNKNNKIGGVVIC